MGALACLMGLVCSISQLLAGAGRCEVDSHLRYRRIRVAAGGVAAIHAGYTVNASAGTLMLPEATRSLGELL